MSLLSSALLVAMLTSCGTHRKILFDSEHWVYLEKDAVYKTVQTTGVTTERLHSLTGSDSNRWDMRIHKERHFQQLGLNLPSGTLIRAQAVYMDSEPLQYAMVSYGGLIIAGPHKGKRVDITQLLKRNHRSYYPAPKYLTKATSSDTQSLWNKISKQPADSELRR